MNSTIMKRIVEYIFGPSAWDLYDQECERKRVEWELREAEMEAEDKEDRKYFDSYFRLVGLAQKGDTYSDEFLTTFFEFVSLSRKEERPELIEGYLQIASIPDYRDKMMDAYFRYLPLLNRGDL